jgi:hypothetical protein
MAIRQIVGYHKRTMTDVTRIMNQIEDGDLSEANALFPFVYDELRKLAAAEIAHEAPGQTFPATGLVHEASIKEIKHPTSGIIGST